MQTDKDNKKEKIAKYKKYAIYGVLIIGTIVAVALIFSGGKDSNEDVDVLNKELPDPTSDELHDNKQQFYEELEHEQFVLSQLSDIEAELNLSNIPSRSENREKEKELHHNKSSIQSVEKAVNNLNSTIEQNSTSTYNNGYSPDAQLQKQLNEANEQILAKEAQLKKAEATALLLKNTVNVPHTANDEKAKEDEKVMPVSALEQSGVVSSLSGARRLGGFYGTENTRKASKNTIKATVYERQVLTDGQFLRMRLAEPMQVSGHVIPAGTIVMGKCQVGLDRLHVSVNSIEYSDVVMSVNLLVYDTDGQAGLYLPGSMENDVLKEIGVDVANSVASSTSASIAVFSSTPNAAEQLKTDVGRGLISGTSKYVSRKLTELKIIVQDNHKLFLVTNTK